MKLSQAKDYLHFVQSAAEGKTIQLLHKGEWKDISEFLANYPPTHYRIKPETKLRPWKREEVPVGALARNKIRDSEHNKYVIVSLNGNDISFGRAEWKSIEKMFDECEHSTDGGKTWKPCGVKE